VIRSLVIAGGVCALLASVAGAAPTRTSPLAVAPNDVIFVVNPDSNTVARLDFSGIAGTLTQEGAVGRYARTVAIARLVLDPDVLRDDPRRLVPEDEVGSRLERGVGPLLQERAIRRMVEAGSCDAAPVVEHLAGLGVHRHEAALRLAAEGPPHAPRIHLHLEPARVRGLDDLPHRVAVVREVVLRVRVQDAREAAPHQVVQVAFHVPRDADAEVGAADDRVSRRGRHLEPSAPGRRCGESAG